jgi:hypothetical protein
MNRSLARSLAIAGGLVLWTGIASSPFAYAKGATLSAGASCHVSIPSATYQAQIPLTGTGLQPGVTYYGQLVHNGGTEVLFGSVASSSGTVSYSGWYTTAGTYTGVITNQKGRAVASCSATA